MMQAAILGSTSGYPANFVRKLTKHNVESVMLTRKEQLQAWALGNNFAIEFERTKNEWYPDSGDVPGATHDDVVEKIRALLEGSKRRGEQSHHGQLRGSKLHVDGRSYQIIGGIGGSLESFEEFPGGISMRGWVVDHRNNAPTTGIVVVQNAIVAGVFQPMVVRPDITEGIASKAIPAGFSLKVRVTFTEGAGDVRPLIRVFSLTQDGFAVPVSSDLPAGRAVQFAAIPFPAEPVNKN